MADPSSLNTAEGASRGRALAFLHLDPPPFHDDWAVHLLAPEDRDRLAGPQGKAEFLANPTSFAMSGVGIGSLMYAEATVLDYVARGWGQYVIMGAGFDSFAMRHPELAGRLRVFEVDHPSVQALKRERLSQAPPVELMPEFVPVDFEVDRLADQLKTSSYDPSRPAVISWMNTLPYLTVGAITSTLAELRKVTCRGSVLVCNYPSEGVPISDEQKAVLASVAANVVKRGEPWQSRFLPDEFITLLSDHDFDLAAHITEHYVNSMFFADRPDGFRAGVPLRITRAIRR